MRQESRAWNDVTITLDITISGSGQGGLSPTALIKRISDGKYWNDSVSSWQDSWVKNALPQYDLALFPGVYTLSIPQQYLDYDAGFPGYLVLLEEATLSVHENLWITPLLRSAHDDLTEDHLEEGSFGRLHVITQGLCQANQRIKNPLYDVNNRMYSASLVVYGTADDAESDINPIATFTISAAYDGNGNMMTYLSKG